MKYKKYDDGTIVSTLKIVRERGLEVAIKESGVTSWAIRVWCKKAGIELPKVPAHDWDWIKSQL